MWFYGGVDISRQTLFKLKSVKKNASWQAAQLLYDVPLKVNPYAFAYAAMRTSIVGKNIGLRGSIAGGGLALAATAYLKRNGTQLEFHHRFNDVKDFISTGIKGTVGAALSYLYMIDKGYMWAGHWEDVVAAASIGPRPDFVFASKTEACLLDAKGSSSNALAIESLVKHEWKRQIWSHRSTIFSFGGTSTEGAVIATGVASGVAARFIKAHGKFGVSAQSNSVINAIKSVQRANYINACFLLGLSNTAFAMLSRNNAPHILQALLNSEVNSMESVKNGIHFGPPRLLLQNGNVTHIMRPFANVGVLQSVFGNFYPNGILPDFDFPKISLDFDENSSDRIVIQGPDGVGAEFIAIKNFDV